MSEILYRAIWRQAQLAQPCENQHAAGIVIHSHFATPTSPSSPGTLGKHEKRRAVPDRGRSPCWKGKPVDTRATTCAKGLAFNPATKPLGCAEVGAVGLTDCNCNIYTGDKRQACRVCQARRKVYNYPMPGNPSKYVACTTQGAFPQPCNTGLKWNQKLQDCTR
ncbi:hypothetical protein D9Q98_002349 [Chlorella vulgaris]|uniref:Chitin-binding type-2 domain-containing protein n=1 Tax=Chlorella vulgaris TaxID=3077 RepID=A0A9D4TWH8_CHLVU|nr:hypothetical protein D9Q98_002349 [Chlorella vulgaris]